MSTDNAPKYLVSLNPAWTGPPGRTIGPSEPCFIFRPSDNFTLPTLYAYRQLCQEGGASPEHVAAIESHIERIRLWRQRNSHLTKTPD